MWHRVFKARFCSASNGGSKRAHSKPWTRCSYNHNIWCWQNLSRRVIELFENRSGGGAIYPPLYGTTDQEKEGSGRGGGWCFLSGFFYGPLSGSPECQWGAWIERDFRSMRRVDSSHGFGMVGLHIGLLDEVSFRSKDGGVSGAPYGPAERNSYGQEMACFQVV